MLGMSLGGAGGYVAEAVPSVKEAAPFHVIARSPRLILSPCPGDRGRVVTFSM